MKPRLRFLHHPERRRAAVAGWLLPAVLFLAAGIGRAANVNDFFAQGLADYRAGLFPEAAAAFEKALQQQPSVGALDNLGLAEWQRGHAGAAILAWERAQWVDPFDARSRANLQFARQALQLDPPALKWFEAVSTRLSAAAWLWLTGVSLWVMAGALILPGVFRRRLAGWPQILATLAFCVFLFGLTANLGVVSRGHLGLVIKTDAPLRLTPTRDSEVIATLNEGEPARQLRTRGNYYLIRTLFGTGWIERGQFGLICPEK
ncbi:MAG TPA: hypothetical protein VFB55_05770 [Verrucomicrobiae bacterium]|nr:hypothetical protein [Verrucomicrobiae bacterium]